MIDHLTLTVRDLVRARDFYTRALAPLGYGVEMEFQDTCGFGAAGKPYLWLRTGPQASAPLHLAFAAKDRKAIDLFHAAALSAGGKDNGAPGVRAHYHPTYYAAFVLDLDGHNIEAVCHADPAALGKVPAAERLKAKAVKARARKQTSKRRGGGKKKVAARARRRARA
ncbi:MAG TPA: VOC family protein [Anaeromyxobacteraceae bacterium]|nr:VOC family protein [Anaeromyxobacteraceae bacterium]